MGKKAERHRRRWKNIYKRPSRRAVQKKVGDKYVWALSPSPREPATAPLYFAYGSNLNVSQMKHRCPHARAFSRLILPDWKLVFRGVADIAPEEGSAVQGGLWRITAHCEWALDAYEGVADDPRWGLYRKEYFPVSYTNASGEDVEERCLVYVMNGRSSLYRPGDSYLKSIEDGYDAFGLDRDVLAKAVEDTPAWRHSYAKSSYGGYGYGGWDDWNWNDETDNYVKGADGIWRRKDAQPDPAPTPKSEPERHEWDEDWSDIEDWPDKDDAESWDDYFHAQGFVQDDDGRWRKRRTRDEDEEEERTPRFASE